MSCIRALPRHSDESVEFCANACCKNVATFSLRTKGANFGCKLSLSTGDLFRRVGRLMFGWPSAGFVGELHRHTGTVRGQPISALAVAHAVDAAAPVELR